MAFTIAPPFPGNPFGVTRPPQHNPSFTPTRIASASAASSGEQWLIQQAVETMAQIRHIPVDATYIQQMGIMPPLRSGLQAKTLLQNSGIQIAFGDLGDGAAHAQWMADRRLILLNQRYRTDFSASNVYALSEALYHELGHVAGNADGESSIQEELNCLALNTLAYRFHCQINPSYAVTASNSPLLNNGVALYNRLFFDVDPSKRALIQRVVEKYGELPITSPGHPVGSGYGNPNPPLAYRIKQQYEQQRIR